MYLLDNDAFNLYLLNEENTMRRVQQYRHVLWLSSIAAEESLTGRLSSLNRARSSRNSLSLPQAHQDLADALVAIHAFPLLVYSEEAEAIFRTFPPTTLRIGPQDCRIAAQDLAHNLTVVTRNLRDFQAIGAPCIDWSLDR